MKMTMTMLLLGTLLIVTGCVVRPPQAGFTADIQDFTVTFTDTSTAPDTDLVAWQWDFGDGASSEEQHPEHTYAAPGTYTVTLTVTDSRNRSNSASMAVTVPVSDGRSFSMMGWTRTNTGNILAGVKVSIVDTEIIAHTDAHGLYLLFEALPEPPVVVKFEKDGYVATSVLVDAFPDTFATVNATLIQMADPVALDADAGGEADDGLGNKLVLPPGALVRRDDGKAVAGDVDVHITPLDVTSMDDLAAFPGEFRAVAAGKSTETVQLETFALADFSVFQNGDDLDLAPNKSGEAYIELVLPDTTPLAPGDIVPLWYFDEEQGLWIEDGAGEVVTDKSGALVYRAPINHLSWWNCDMPITETHCFTGVVLDENGAPVANARIEAQGLDYNGSSYATSGPDGSFCVDVKRNSQVQIALYLPGGNMVLDIIVANAPDTPAQCASGGCSTLPRPLSPVLDACVSGFVKDEFDQPVTNATVYSSLGAHAVTDASGYFCMNTPSDVAATFFVAGRPPLSVQIPADAASCEDGGCVEIALTVEYPEDGDFVGFISVDLDHTGGLAGTYDLNASAMFIGFGAMAGGFGMTPEFGCTVHVWDFTPGTEGEFGEGEFEGIDWETIWEDLLNYPVLDPGAPGEVTNGAEVTLLYRMSDFSDWLGSFAYGMFSNEESAGGAYAPGDTLTFSWPGGVDIAAFSAAIDLPGDPSPVTPDLGAVAVPFDLNDALTLTWTPTGSDYATITLFASGFTLEFDYFSTTISCVVEDSGSYTIPQDLMEQLPSDAPMLTVGLNIDFSISKEIEAPLTQGGDGVMWMGAQYSESGYWFDMGFAGL